MIYIYHNFYISTGTLFIHSITIFTLALEHSLYILLISCPPSGFLSLPTCRCVNVIKDSLPLCYQRIFGKVISPRDLARTITNEIKDAIIFIGSDISVLSQ